MTFYELKDRVMAAPFQAHSKQELWHRYLADIAPGDLCLEFGVATGRSINYMAATRPRTAFHGFDSFKGLPEAWGRCGRGRFRVNPKKLKFQPNITLHEGLFADTLPEFIRQPPTGRLSGVHIDCDLGSSATTVLTQLSDILLAAKPALLFDEFYNYKGFEEHEFRAFLAWINATGCAFEVIGRDVLHKQVMIQLT